MPPKVMRRKRPQAAKPAPHSRNFAVAPATADGTRRGEVVYVFSVPLAPKG